MKLMYSKASIAW